MGVLKLTGLDQLDPDELKRVLAHILSEYVISPSAARMLEQADKGYSVRQIADWSGGEYSHVTVYSRVQQARNNARPIA